MKGKEKKSETRSTRSKSPARGPSPKKESSPAREPKGKSPTRGKSPGRGKSPAKSKTPAKELATPTSSKSRGRSKSPGRTPGKTGGKAESSRRASPISEAKRDVKVNETTKPNRKSEVVPDDRSRRSSTKLATESTGLIQRKVDSHAKVEAVKGETTKCLSLCSKIPCCGLLTSLLLTVILIGVTTAVSLSCNLNQCNITDIASLSKPPLDYTSYCNLQALGIVVGWFFVQLILASLPIGWTRVGGNLPDGSKLQYRCNGLLSLIITGLAVGAIHYQFKVQLVKTFEKLFLQMLTASVALALVVSFISYIRARRLQASLLSASAKTGWFLIDFTFGREIHPRLGPVNKKMFSVIHMGVLGWAVMNGIVILKAYATGVSSFNWTFVAVAAMQYLFILDVLLFQASLSTSLMISHDGFGFFFVFMTFVWVPFIHSLQLRYLLHNAQPNNWPVLGTAIALFVLGLVIARCANFTKDRLRKQTASRTNNETIQTSSFGKPLIVSGLWGRCRHPNYFGCLLMAIGWSLPCGLCSPVTYGCILYPLLMFALRARRDGKLCEQKHGTGAWTSYCKRVRSRLIPFIY